jgi:IclR family KDG regulon transcriptional repressor
MVHMQQLPLCLAAHGVQHAHMAQDSSTSLTRAIAILIALGSPDVAGGHGIGVMQIAKIIGREKSQVSRTLKTLAEAGLVLRDPETMQYRLGWRFFTLAASAVDQHLLAVAPTVLRQLVARVHEAAHLSVLEGRQVLTVMSETPGRAIQAAAWVGRAAPMHCTSAGRALLFDHNDDEVREMFVQEGLTAAGPRAPRNVDELLARLHEARQVGFVVIDEEFEPGLVAVAAPVRDFRGRVTAAVNISVPKFRATEFLPTGGREVKAAADYLSRALAAIPPEPGETTVAPPNTEDTRRNL